MLSQIQILRPCSRHLLAAPESRHHRQPLWLLQLQDGLALAVTTTRLELVPSTILNMATTMS
jgi:hypothetical protein